MATYTADDVKRAREWLADVKPGETIYTILRHVSSSGMSRRISLIRMVKGEPRNIDWPAAVILGATVNRNNREGIAVGGCGMDMGFHLVYNLGRVLFPNGFKLTGKNHARNGDTSGRDSDGGYALNHRWL